MRKRQPPFNETGDGETAVLVAALRRLLESWLLAGDINRHSERTLESRRGGKSRIVPFSRDTKRALYHHLNEREWEPDAPLFLSGRGKRAGDGLTRNGLMQLIRRIGRAARAAGARCSPHTFRHTFAIEFLRAGGNVFTLQQMLGHTHLAMTNRYVAIAQADIQNQHRQFSPVARLKGKAK